MTIIELAKAHGIHVYNNPVDGLDQLQCFATAIGKQAIEDYKASLVPVAFHIGNEDGSYSRIGATYNNESTAKNHIVSYKGELVACIVPLYDLGKTK